MTGITMTIILVVIIVVFAGIFFKKVQNNYNIQIIQADYESQPLMKSAKKKLHENVPKRNVKKNDGGTFLEREAASGRIIRKGKIKFLENYLINFINSIY